MNRTRRGRAAAVAAFTAAVALLVMPMAQASHIMSMSPDSGPPGSTVRIFGSGTRGEPCTVTFAGEPVPVRDGDCAADEDGVVDERFTVPQVARDAIYDVEFWVSNYEFEPRDTFGFYVPPAPTISVTPTEGPRGATLRVTGSNFAAPCAIHFDEEQQIPAARCDVSRDGTIEETFPVPSSAAVGDHTVRACSLCGRPGEERARAGFRVTEPSSSDDGGTVSDEGGTIRIDPVEGPPGTSAQVAGSGWDPSTALTVRFGGELIADLRPGDDHFSGDGTFAVPVEAPDWPSGAVDVTACQRCATEFETSARTTFTVVPSIAVVPTVLRRGEIAMASGRGFPADAVISLRWQPGIGHVLARTDETGRFVSAALLAFPKDRSGQRRVVASGQPDPRRVAESDLVLVVPGSAQPSDFVSRR